MASGFSYGGGRSRCFAYWQDFQKCYIKSDNPVECRPQADDYLECLHRPKEIARAKAVQDEFIRKTQAAAGNDGRKTAEVLMQGVTATVNPRPQTDQQDSGAKQ
ncbi:hypothetical protein AX17_004669 [Amanita inopinata Kibby_2008]|nr:hypothetical protein AX17_004669 [Amanita inopinata Kibby_2008]